MLQGFDDKGCIRCLRFQTSVNSFIEWPVNPLTPAGDGIGLQGTSIRPTMPCSPAETDRQYLAGNSACAGRRPRHFNEPWNKKCESRAIQFRELYFPRPRTSTMPNVDGEAGLCACRLYSLAQRPSHSELMMLASKRLSESQLSRKRPVRRLLKYSIAFMYRWIGILLCRLFLPT